MNHVEFMPYHNRHIRFRTRSGQQSQGVVLDLMNEKAKDTEYAFIETKDMIGWKNAEKIRDITTMRRLQTSIDISDIEWAEVIR